MISETDSGKSDDYFIVHIPKKKMWEKINDILLIEGYDWDGASARKYWDVCGENSCIRIDHETKKLHFASKDHYKRFGYLVMSTKDFMQLYHKFYGFVGFFRTIIIRLRLFLIRRSVK